MDDGACLYYKLTYEPKGSGELKNTKVNDNVKTIPYCHLCEVIKLV